MSVHININTPKCSFVYKIEVPNQTNKHLDEPTIPPAITKEPLKWQKLCNWIDQYHHIFNLWFSWIKSWPSKQISWVFNFIFLTDIGGHGRTQKPKKARKKVSRSCTSLNESPVLLFWLNAIPPIILKHKFCLHKIFFIIYQP